jgi:adenylylsulfate kinase-like enzyme
VSREDLQRAGEACAERALERHVEQPHGFELPSLLQGSGVDRVQPAVLCELRDRRLRVLVVSGDEYVDRLSGDLPFTKSARERGVERLDDARPGCAAG